MDSRRKNSSGFTLVEVMVATTLLTLLGMGLISSGIAVLRMTQYMRISTEARAMAMERMEELVNGGRVRLAESSYAALQPQTNTATLGHPMVRRVEVYWHTASGAPATAASNAYAEVHVDVEYYEPIRQRTKTDTFSVIVL